MRNCDGNKKEQDTKAKPYNEVTFVETTGLKIPATGLSINLPLRPSQSVKCQRW